MPRLCFGWLRLLRGQPRLYRTQPPELAKRCSKPLLASPRGLRRDSHSTCCFLCEELMPNRSDLARNMGLMIAAAAHPILTLAAIFCVLFPSASADTTNTALTFWKQSLPGVPMPSTIATRVSPLTPSKIEQFSATLSKGISSLQSAQFCRDGDFYCKSDVAPALYAYGCIQCVTTATIFDPNLFLPNKELRRGGILTMPDLYDPEPMKAFLPAALSQKIPFSSKSLPQLLKIMHISEDSNMARNMATVLTTCETAKGVDDREECITTVESMVTFVASVLGSKDVELISESDTVGSQEKVKVLNVEEMSLAKAPVTCHSWVFPFAVYYCHYVKEVRVLKVQLQALSGGELIERSVLCHKWKELLRPKYQVLHITPGEEACHFIYASNLMFVYRAAGSQK